MIKILFIGDIVGRPARKYLGEKLFAVRKELSLDCVIANGENASGGSGLTPDNARELFSAGIDILTSGDHIFKKKVAKDTLEKFDVIRPLNYGELAWGRGFLIKKIKGVRVGVINLLGRVFMPPIDCPFKAVRDILPQMREQADVVLVDMHAEATSEMVAMGYFLGGKVSAVLGTHTHIPTADERIIDGYTAYITDVGMTGSCDSVLGREKSHIIERFLTGMPLRFNLACSDVRIQGVVMDIDDATGQALSIKRVEYREEEEVGR